MNILLLSRYGTSGASSRYRSYQYLPYLQRLGHRIEVAPLLSNLYLQRLYEGKSLPGLDVAASYIRRTAQLMWPSSYDLLWMEYEAFPWMPSWLESFLFASKSTVPLVVDYDDAIFHRYDRHQSGFVRRLLGKKIDRIMRRANLVVAGNEYIAARAREAGARRVEIVPTVVDLDRYPLSPMPENRVFTVGWIGTPQTTHYLKEVARALEVVCRNGDARLVTIGSREVDIRNVPVEIKSWSEESEAKEMQGFDVGIMPLLDSPWERGKCGQKLIQYMACARPVVASPVGVNSSIVEHGTNGYLASSHDEWVTALNTLRRERSMRRTMGLAGRKKVEQQYSLTVTAPRLEELLREAGRGS